MKITEIINESQILTERISSNILVVDVQRAYEPYCKRVAGKIMDLLNNSTGKVLILYNGETANETEDDVIEYMVRNGLDEDLAYTLPKIQKEYGFFRNWMDQGVSDKTIIAAIRFLVQHKEIETFEMESELPESILDELNKCGVSLDNDSLQIPELSVAMLKNLSPFYMCGGGRSECLREIELLCNAFNIRYRRIDSLCY
jgi:3-polyprenyl-4-hydroxybenzoate decarboxylase